MQWDKSIDDPYLLSYKVYYYTISGNPDSLSAGDYAVAATYIDVTDGEVKRINIVEGGPKHILLLKKSDGESQTQITLHLKDNSRYYYFAVSSVDGRELEGVSTDELPQPLRRLTLSKEGTGRGIVNAPPGVNSEIDCGTGCASDVADYGHGALVTLTATAGTGQTFIGWPSGCDSVDSQQKCNVNLREPRTVKAHFIPLPKGDINQNGVVNLADAILIFQAMLRTGTLPPSSYIFDTNQDGKLGLADAIYILQKTAGLR